VVYVRKLRKKELCGGVKGSERDEACDRSSGKKVLERFKRYKQKACECLKHGGTKDAKVEISLGFILMKNALIEESLGDDESCLWGDLAQAVSRRDGSAQEKRQRTLEKLEDALRRFEAIEGLAGDSWTDSWAGAAMSLVDNIEYSDLDIEIFSFRCSDLEIKGVFTLGRFFSALVNNSDAEIHSLRATPNQGIPMSGFTLWTPKQVLIEGDVGHIGETMSDGRIMVSGNASVVGDRMSGGSILVDGDVVGSDKCEVSVGEDMTGGEIEIKGEIKDTDFLRRLPGNITARNWKVLPTTKSDEEA
jgi:hypothetical protein